MASGATTSAELVEAYVDRIATLGPLVNAVRCLAPDAHERAEALDTERRDGQVRGPLHGVPVLIKDNIDIAGLPTTAGALALEHSVPDKDADLVVRLREAGAVVIGKTNLTELANFMAEEMPSGYSSLGGQVLNPYDVSRTPSGSSSGSGAAAALGLATVTVGTETDGSILSPSCDAEPGRAQADRSAWCPGGGILPIATSQDCAGPMCRTVADAAALLGVLTGETYGEGSGPDTLRGVRLAVPPEPDDLHAAGGRGVPRRARRATRPRCRARRGTGAAGDRRAAGAALRVRSRRRRLPGHAARGRADPDDARAGRVERGARRRDAEVRPGTRREGAGGRPRRRAGGVRGTPGPRPRGRRRARHRRHADDAPTQRPSSFPGRTAVATAARAGYSEPGGAGRLPPRGPGPGRADVRGPARAARGCCWRSARRSRRRPRSASRRRSSTRRCSVSS